MRSPPVSVLLLESQDAVQQWLNVKQELARYVVCVYIVCTCGCHFLYPFCHTPTPWSICHSTTFILTRHLCRDSSNLNDDVFYSSSSEAGAKSDLLWYKSIVQKKKPAAGNGNIKSSAATTAASKQRMATMTSNARSSAATATTRRRSAAAAAAASQDTGTSKGPKSETMVSSKEGVGTRSEAY